MPLTNSISTLSFKKWLWSDKENRLLFRFTVTTVLINFLILKFFYPLPNFMPPDSNSYLQAAYEQKFINMWPIGYSWFLRIFPFITRSSILLVWVQYLALQIAILYFLFSVRYLLSPGKWVFRILLSFSILNPLISHISNFVSSDALFTAICLVWFTQVLWLIYKPFFGLVFLHSIVLLIAFIVRYNALYFPIISIILIITSGKIKSSIKAVSVGTIVFGLCVFIGKTQYAYRQETRTIQFSAFGGWQMAANALYGYSHANRDSAYKLPSEFQELHRLVNDHAMYLKRFPESLRPDRDPGIYYMWDFSSPLVVYMNQKSGRTSMPYFKRWARMAPLYSKYGWYIVRKHPGPFLKFYILPNLVKYYAPPTSFMGFYNQRSDVVDPIVVRWFGWQNNKVKNYFGAKTIEITRIFPVIIAIVNLSLVLSFLAYVFLNGFKRSNAHLKAILLWMVTFWIVNMLFSVFAAPIELRYQLFNFQITFAFLCLLLEFIFIESSGTSHTSQSIPVGSTQKAEFIIQG